MKQKDLIEVPIAEIRILNPRTRSKRMFGEIVSSLETVGLKRPVTVTQRAQAGDGTQFDLVCGQGRVEALLALGQTTVPVNIIDATIQDQLLMSLIENVARRAPSNRSLFREVKTLSERGYSTRQIAQKLGNDSDYIGAIIQLIKNDAAYLVDAVEAGRLPISIALIIATARDPEVQKALSDAYETGELRGARFKEAKKIIARFRMKKRGGMQTNSRSQLSGEELVREYQQRTREQQALVKRAASIRERLVLIRSAMKSLLIDEHFVTLLRAEQLHDMPEQLMPGDWKNDGEKVGPNSIPEVGIPDTA